MQGPQAVGLSKEEVEQLYREQFRSVFNYLYFRVLDRQVAEDLTADVFVRIMRSRETFDPSKATPVNWLFRIARNRLYDYFRTNRPTDDIETAPAAKFAVVDEYGGLDDKAATARALLTVLTDEERELVFMKFWNEMSNKEIAEALNMNASTVSTKVSRAVAKMRKEHAQLEG